MSKVASMDMVRYPLQIRSAILLCTLSSLSRFLDKSRDLFQIGTAYRAMESTTDVSHFLLLELGLSMLTISRPRLPTPLLCSLYHVCLKTSFLVQPYTQILQPLGRLDLPIHSPQNWYFPELFFSTLLWPQFLMVQYPIRVFLAKNWSFWWIGLP